MSNKFGNEYEVGFGFDSSDAGARTLYVGGHYRLFNGNDDFSPGAVNYGTANSPYGDHIFVVTGAVTVDQVTIRVTGASWDDSTGTRTAADTEDIIIPSATPIDSYFETSKKFIGQVTIQTIAGTAINCNYGGAKYWDNGDHQFWLKGFEVTGTGGANDAAANFIIRHHKTTGWTYNAGSTPTPPTPIAEMASAGAYSTDSDVKTDEPFAFKRTGLSVQIDGNDSEGLIFEAVQGVARPFVDCNVVYRISSAR